MPTAIPYSFTAHQVPQPAFEVEIPAVCGQGDQQPLLRRVRQGQDGPDCGALVECVRCKPLGGRKELPSLRTLSFARNARDTRGESEERYVHQHEIYFTPSLIVRP